MLPQAADVNNVSYNYRMNWPVCKTTELTAIELDENLTSLNCPGCGGNYTEIKRIRWWLDTKTNKEELLAYLTDRDPYAA